MHNVIVIGAGGHGKVIADIILQSGDEVVGFLDDHPTLGRTVLGRPVLGTIAEAGRYLAHGCEFVLAIGNNEIRRSLARRLILPYYTAVHPRAIIASEVSLGVGTVVMAGAIVNPGAVIGRHCILNSGCIVEHDNQIADYVHICPGVALAGTVSVGEATQIGVGSTVRNNVSIAAGCQLGAGTVVVKDIAKAGVYVGAPARWLRGSR